MQGGRTVVVGSPQTLSGNRTESLGLLTDSSVTFGPCDVREESLLFLTEPLRSPYDNHTVLGVRLSFVYYRTCKTSQCIMAPPKGKGKRSSQNYIDDEDEPGEKQAALNDRIMQRIVQFFEVIFQTNNRTKN